MLKEHFAKVEEWQPIPCIITINIQLSLEATLIHIYTPTKNADILDRENVYVNLKRFSNKSRTMNREVIVIGDLNARIYRRHKNAQDVIKPHGGEATRNKNGHNLIEFCIDNNMIIRNSFGPHKPVYKISFSSDTFLREMSTA